MRISKRHQSSSNCGHFISDMMTADYTVLFARSQGKLQELIFYLNVGRSLASIGY